MDMRGSRQLAVTQQQAWDALNDPEVLKRCIAGCEKLETTGEDQFSVGMALKIGPVSARFAGKIQLSDKIPPESYRLNFDGQGGAAGFGKGEATVSLTPAPLREDSECVLVYVVHATVGGKIAQLGQRLVDGAAKSMADDFFKRFDLELQAMHPVAEPVLEPVLDPVGAPVTEPGLVASAAQQPPGTANSTPAASKTPENTVANNAVHHAERPEFDLVRDLKLPWWAWLGLACALVAAYAFDLFDFFDTFQ
jgi:uncharacterized protein